MTSLPEGPTTWKTHRVAVVVLNYPVRVRSLSKAALGKSEALVHHVRIVLGPCPQKWDKTEHVGAVAVLTRCGREIDAYPETGQTTERPCEQCSRVKQEWPQAVLVRLLPAIAEAVTTDDWSQQYWAAHGTTLFSRWQPDENAAPEPPERTCPETQSA